MNYPPLSLEEATDLCARSQHLIGQPLNPQIHAHGYIEHVAVAPFGDRRAQEHFAERLSASQHHAQTPVHASDGYAVLVIARPRRWLRQAVVFLDVRPYQRLRAAYLKHRPTRLKTVFAYPV